MLILLIDDDELSRELLTLLLEVEGYTVVSAPSGDEALSALTEMVPPPAAVLTDLQMPGLSGTGLATALRAALPGGVPVIAMSGSDSRPPGTPALAPAGFDGFLLKPFGVVEFRAVLAAADGEKVIPPDTSGGEVASGSNDALAAELDEDVFLKMRELMPAAQLGQMYTLCIADARTRLEAMRASAEGGDDAAYRREAHAIKGGAGMIGASEIYGLATKAEQNGIVQPENVVAQSAASAGTSRVTELSEQLSRACERLERILVERLQP